LSAALQLKRARRETAANARQAFLEFFERQLERIERDDGRERT